MSYFKNHISLFSRLHITQSRSLSSKSAQFSLTDRRRHCRYYTSTTRETWLTKYLRSSPKALIIFRKMTRIIGIDSEKQVVARRAYVFYRDACVARESDTTFHVECGLPTTFQSWFTITNLHIWLMTVRFRALPDRYNRYFIQALIDHFFFDAEERVRNVLSERVPERLITQQMHILREQWSGLGLTLDHCLGLSTLSKDGDIEMAAAIWRNFLGGRGARGIDDPGPDKVRHRVNLWGKSGMPRSLRKGVTEETLKVLEETDDGSGVYDYTGEKTKLYVKYPELMYTLVAYVRRELVRLESISDEDIISGKGIGKFGPLTLSTQK